MLLAAYGFNLNPTSQSSQDKISQWNPTDLNVNVAKTTLSKNSYMDVLCCFI